MLLAEVLSKLAKDGFEITFFADGNEFRFEVAGRDGKDRYTLSHTCTYSDFVNHGDKLIVEVTEALKKHVPTIKRRVIRIESDTSRFIFGPRRIKKDQQSRRKGRDEKKD